MKPYILAAGLLIASASAQPAMATTYVYTYTGNITAGWDPDHYFGLSDASLTNAAVTAVFKFTPTGAATNTVSATEALLAGDGISSAKITINGQTLDISGAFGLTLVKNGATDFLYQYVAQINDYGPAAFTTDEYLAIPGKKKLDAGIGIENQPASFLPSTSVAQNVPGYLPAKDAFGHFTYVDTTGSTPDIVQGFYKITSVSVAAVPEPATWAMMVLGFAAVGAALRQRRGKQDQAQGALAFARI